MKLALVLMSFGVLYAQNPSGAPQPKSGTEVRKLQSITWDIQGRSLSWWLQKGTEIDGKFVPDSPENNESYEIRPDQKLMTVLNENRGFSDAEATEVYHLLNALTLYCAESVIWWGRGGGTPIVPGDNKAQPAKPPAQPEEAAPSKNSVLIDFVPHGGIH